ncbi:MAG: glutamate-5-semialdehyde dehydrogenase [Phocaeicola vulgatus]|nr:glutamate-5-semialdehyde dehydrogenase [Phocaeicola vulgatus]
MEQIKDIFKQVRQAKGSLAFCKEEIINDTLYALADRVEAATDRILEENAKDLAAMDPSNPKYDRLKLTAERIHAIAQGIRQVATLPSPSGRILSEAVRPNGMKLTKVSVPFGVIGIIYEARPNVTLDVFALCFKSGNACILKGGSDADFSNRILVEIIRNTLLDVAHLSPYLVALLPAGHDSADALLHARGYVDLIIPRGGKGLIDYVRQNATIPVIETGAGVCHVYFDKEGDVAKGAAIIRNAKTRRVSVCNALDCLIIDVNRLTDLSTLCSGLQQDNVEIYADDLCYNYLKTSYPSHLLKHASTDTFGTEFIYGSGHSECIVTENDRAADYFMKMVDAACVYVNVPTSFTDGGEFGLGAEIGISTQKLHARGPMGLEELNTYKWIIQGDGQIRQ